MRRLRISIILALSVFFCGCNDKPVSLGVSPVNQEPHAEKETKNHRELCAQKGDSTCSDYLADLASHAEWDDDRWPHPSWFGLPRTVSKDTKPSKE